MFLVSQWSFLILILLNISEASPGKDTGTDADNIDRNDFCASICKSDQNVRQTIENIIDGKLFDLKNQFTMRFEKITGLMYDVNRDVKKILQNKTVQQSVNNTIPDSVTKEKTIINALNYIPELKEHISNLLNVSENIQTSVAKTNRKLNGLKYNETTPGKCGLINDDSLYTNILEQITSLRNAIIDPDYEERTILKSIGNIINTRLDAMETIWWDSFTEKLEILENKRNKYIQDSVEKHISDRITNMTVQIKDKIDSVIKEKQIFENIEKTNQKLTGVDNIPNVEVQILNVFNNNTKIMNTSVATINPDLESGNNTNHTFCNINVPSSIKLNNNIWKNKQIPEKDELDSFMIIKTGCTYQPLQYDRYVSRPVAKAFDGELFEWRGAVRARDAAYIGVWWPSSYGYSFNIGEDDNTNTKYYRWRPWKELQRLSTPRILSDDRYTPFYIKIHNGIMTFGKECDREPIFTIKNISITSGEMVNISFRPKSLFGAKYLHKCPAKDASLGAHL